MEQKQEELMLDFVVNKQTCTKCGQCIADCPAMIILMEEGYPSIAADRESACYKCQHCFAVCPVGAISIFGLDPEQSKHLPGDLPSAGQMETLIKGRRAVRNYKKENLEPGLLQRLLDTAGYAPSGVNSRQVLLSVVDDRDTLAKLRDEVMK
jgi:ferredoxin